DPALVAGQHPRRPAARARRRWRALSAPAGEPAGRCLVSAWLTPLIGGILIGLAATLLLWLNGRIAGISGILGGVVMPRAGETAWRVLFLLGLIGAGTAGLLLVPGAYTPRQGFPVWMLVVAGLLVGFGTRMGNG